jgi:hypothetical protein
MTLLELQRRMGGVIMAPLARRNSGGPERKEAEALVKPNSRLTSLERLDIYRRSYWYRLLDSLYDDFPGLCGILGRRAFNLLSEAYLADCPSQSFTMRDLGSRLWDWLRDHAEYGGTNLTLALDMVQLEWAHIEAFDSAAQKPLGPEDLLELGPEMKFGLQPHITLLKLQYPVDDLRIRVQAASDQGRSGAASNAVLRRRERGIVHKYSALRPEPTFLAVHRVNFSVYYRRLAANEFRILDALRRGSHLEEAIGLLEESHEMVETWFSSWSRLGWFCRVANSKEV